MGEVEGQRLLEDHDVDALAELGPQQGLSDEDPALGEGDQDDDEGLEGDEAEDGGGVAGALAGREDGVDDELSDVGGAGGEEADEEGQGGEDQGQRLAGRPHEVEGAAAVTEDAEEADEPRFFGRCGHGGSIARGGADLTVSG